MQERPAATFANRLLEGSSIEGLNALEPDCIDLAFADPPYNIGFSYDVYQDKLDTPAYLAWTQSWLEAVHRGLKPTGALWLAIGDEYAAEIKVLAEKVGFHLRNWVIWYYTFGVHCNQKFGRSHTHLLYLVKDAKNFTFNDGVIRVPSARQLVYNDLRANPQGRVPDNTWIWRPQDAQDGFRADHDLWYFARVAGTFKERAGFHGCQMPERLLERIIRCCSQPDDIVLDPFAGSGSTLIVAKKLGRHWLGYDLSPEYVRHATARLAAVDIGDPIEGPEDALTSAPSTPIALQAHNQPIDEAGLIEAFRKGAQGHSIDRVITDPVLNAGFLEQCSRLGLAGRPRDWNRTLLGLRKAGKLLKVATTKNTQLTWEAMDPFVFASEMALRRLLDMGYPSLDHVLCDPLAAAKFDAVARSLAPGFTSFQYRWAALRLRKDASSRRKSSEERGSAMPGNPRMIALNDTTLGEMRSIPAVYLLSPKDAGPVYVGETNDLSARTERTLKAQNALDLFVPNSGEWELALYELEGSNHGDRRGLQSLLIGQNRPAMNFLDLAV